MSNAAYYIKTDAGRSEIKTRAHKLSAGLRSLLLVVDGQRNDAQLDQVMGRTSSRRCLDDRDGVRDRCVHHQAPERIDELL